MPPFQGVPFDFDWQSRQQMPLPALPFTAPPGVLALHHQQQQLHPSFAPSPPAQQLPVQLAEDRSQGIEVEHVLVGLALACFLMMLLMLIVIMKMHSSTIAMLSSQQNLMWQLIVATQLQLQNKRQR